MVFDPKRITQALRQRVNTVAETRLKAAAAVAKSAADREADRMLVFLSRLIESGLEAPPEFAADWKPLTDRWKRRKKTHPASRFFRHTGELAAGLRDTEPGQAFGRARVERARKSHGKGAVHILDQIEIRPFRKMTAAAAKQPEKLLHPDDARKLLGRKRYYRPLLGPFIAHWIRFRIVPAVRRALKEQGFVA